MTPEQIEEITNDIQTAISMADAKSVIAAAKGLNSLLAALEESQQHIDKLELYVKSLEFNREDTQKRANDKLRERDTKLVEAQQTIDRQKSVLRYYARPDSYVDDGVLTKLPILDDGGLLARLCLGIDGTEEGGKKS